jgi:outer membrane protein insertion porin family
MLKYKLLAFIFIAASFAATAQENNFSYESPKKYLIKEINVSGLKFLDSGVLISVSGLAVGDSILIPGDAITNAIKKLWNQGLFSDVKITENKIDGSDIYLDIYLQEQPRISSFSFKGVRKGEVDDLKEK